jgi:hypothetical protein
MCGTVGGPLQLRPLLIMNSSYSSDRHRRRIAQLLEHVRRVFPDSDWSTSYEIPKDWEGLAGAQPEDYPRELGRCLCTILYHQTEIQLAMYSLMLVPLIRNRVVWEQKAKQKIRTLTPAQRQATAEFVHLCSDLGDSIATRGWTQLWSDIASTGGDLDKIWPEE